MWVCERAGGPSDVLVFSSRLFEVNQCESRPFIKYVIYCNRIPDSIGVAGTLIGSLRRSFFSLGMYVTKLKDVFHRVSAEIHFWIRHRADLKHNLLPVSCNFQMR